MTPGGAGADWYARGVGGAAARDINEIPTGIPPLQGSMLMPVGMSRGEDQSSERRVPRPICLAREERFSA
jgi:hypothetical protein